MQIKDAYVVDVNFDGDIASNAIGFFVFAGKDALVETKEIVKTALIDLNKYYYHKFCFEATVIIYDSEFNISDVIKNDKLLEDFINDGGNSFGNWNISIIKS